MRNRCYSIFFKKYLHVEKYSYKYTWKMDVLLQTVSHKWDVLTIKWKCNFSPLCSCCTHHWIFTDTCNSFLNNKTWCLHNSCQIFNLITTFFWGKMNFSILYVAISDVNVLKLNKLAIMIAKKCGFVMHIFSVNGNCLNVLFFTFYWEP